MIFIFAGVNHDKIARFSLYVKRIMVQLRNTDALYLCKVHMDKPMLEFVCVKMGICQRK